ncbi:hypothetical protein JCM16358_02160 [Halanaerocella petrolearia]
MDKSPNDYLKNLGELQKQNKVETEEDEHINCKSEYLQALKRAKTGQQKSENNKAEKTTKKLNLNSFKKISVVKFITNLLKEEPQN